MADADISFLGLVLAEENRRRKALPLYSLIALSMFREEKRLTSEQLAEGIQQDKKRAVHTLEELLEAGSEQPHGTDRGRHYTLSPKIIFPTINRGFDNTSRRINIRASLPLVNINLLPPGQPPNILDNEFA